jgi:hypothetical protein
VKWHKGETCSEYDYRTNARLKAEEEEASKTLMEATTKPCPGCTRPIEKNQGCNHMQCKYPSFQETVLALASCFLDADVNVRCEMSCSLLLDVFVAVLCVGCLCAGFRGLLRLSSKSGII